MIFPYCLNYLSDCIPQNNLSKTCFDIIAHLCGKKNECKKLNFCFGCLILLVILQCLLKKSLTVKILSCYFDHERTHSGLLESSIIKTTNYIYKICSVFWKLKLFPGLFLQDLSFMLCLPHIIYWIVYLIWFGDVL